MCLREIRLRRIIIDFSSKLCYTYFTQLHRHKYNKGSDMHMTENELLLVISELFDTKLKSTLQTELQTMKDDIRDLKHHITNVELHLENITDKNIQLLAENYVPAAKRYEQAVPTIEAMQADIEIIKKVVTEHSEKLQKLA